jgi:hypothetical protein
VRESSVVRPDWVVNFSQVKMIATTHGGNIIRFQKEARQAALAEDLKLVDFK